MGARSAIGREAARAFAATGSRLVLAGRDEIRGAEVANLLRGEGAEAIFVRADVLDESDVERLMSCAVSTYGRLDYAFNNSGGTFGVAGPITEMEQKDWDTVIGANLKGTWLLMKHELLRMREAGGGAIVNTTGVLGLAAAPNLAAYTAAKHGAIGLTKAAALENAHLGIRVNAIAPGSTRRTESSEEEDRRMGAAAATVPMGRLGAAHEVGIAAAWLCSNAASFVTGHVFTIDGGWSAKL